MQTIILNGRLGQDAEVKQTRDNRSFTTFSVAVNSQVNNETKTTWYRVAWFDYREKMVQYLKKGCAVSVIGSLNIDLEKTEHILLDL